MPFKPVPRLRGFDYCGPHRCFVTFCTHARQPYFQSGDAVSLIAAQLLRTATDHAFAVIAYCYMPDHLHLLVEGCAVDATLAQFVRSFKQRSAFHWKQQAGGTLWQRSYYDHVLRDDESTRDVARYILENPLRAGLAARVEDYPYLGSMTMSIGDLLLSVSDDR